MNLAIQFRLLIAGLLASIFILLSPVSYAADCEGRYFSPDDYRSEHALAQPHKDFRDMAKAAQLGRAVDMRNLAVSYEAGFLVSKCLDKAVYWYKKAAQGGDKIATQWIDEYIELKRMGDGPGCVGAFCTAANKSQSARLATFYSGHNGHYFAPLTINGVTEPGLIDTGASSIAMSADTAQRYGIDKLPGAEGKASTANGVITTRNVLVPSITVAGITLEHVRVSIGITGTTLIGMSFLSRLNVQMTSGTLTLAKRE